MNYLSLRSFWNSKTLYVTQSIESYYIITDALLNLTIASITIIFLPYLTCKAKGNFIEANKIMNDKLTVTHNVSLGYKIKREDQLKVLIKN